MQLLIKVENNQPVGHPIVFSNFLMIHPGSDYDNLPAGYAKFTRIQRPTDSLFETVSDTPEYVWEDGVVVDKWAVTPFTAEEKAQRIEEVRSQQPFPSWTFIEEELRFEPPVPYPGDDQPYTWNEDAGNWEIVQDAV